MSRHQISITNDDGIESVGLHVLAKRLTSIGDVTVIAPNQSSSGSSASLGALHEIDGGPDQTSGTSILGDVLWDTSAAIAAGLVAAMLADPASDARVLNVNVPNLPINELKGWRWATLSQEHPQAVAAAAVQKKEGEDPNAYRVKLSWNSQAPDTPETDSGTVLEDYISATWLSRIEALDLPTPSVDEALDRLLESP